MKVAFYTLGCKVNQYETNAMQNDFEKAGYEVVGFSDFSDVYVINTCTVTGMSDKKSRQVLRRAKQINPNSIVCAVGCYAQVAKDEILKIDDVDIILGTVEKKDILNKIEEFKKQNRRIIDVENILRIQPYEEYNGIAFSEHVRAEIKIQDGCDRFCSYCIIPYARGPVRSRNKESIIKEINEISKKGIKEVVLTGIHISSYGKDFEKGANDALSNTGTEDATNYHMLDLLYEINKIDGIERIRLGSLEPRIITEKFVSELTKIDKLCNHFHLSLQSGCDETLKRMNRKYSTDEFRKIVKLLRDNINEVALTTDVIVGFPGETDEEFEITRKFLEEIKFSKMHVFKYSKRKGTKAAEMPNQVPENIKDTRSDVLLKMTSENEKEFASRYIGKNIRVLFENGKEGHTTNYIKVNLVNENKSFTNKIVEINATDVINDGEILCKDGTE